MIPDAAGAEVVTPAVLAWAWADGSLNGCFNLYRPWLLHCHAGSDAQGELTKGKGDPDAPDALLIVDKQRNGEWEGRIALWYDRDSQQFLPSRHAKPMDLMCFW